MPKTARAQGAAAQRDAETAKERAANLEKEAAEARLEQERLKSIVAWCALSPGMMDALVGALSAKGGSITLAYVQNDPEAVFLAAQISRAFEAASGRVKDTKWQVQVLPRMYSDRVVFELHIPDRGNDISRLVQQAFTLAGIPYQTDDVPYTGTNIGGVVRTGAMAVTTDALIIVGSKPPPL